MKLRALHIGALLILCLFFACRPKQELAPPETPEPKVSTPKEAHKGSTIGTIRDLRGMDGCQFIVELEDETRLIPMKLDARFRKDGLRVTFTFKPAQAMTTCMSGLPVYITHIKSIE